MKSLVMKDSKKVLLCQSKVATEYTQEVHNLFQKENFPSLLTLLISS